MKIVFCHTDFRVYWPPRLLALDAFLKHHDADLHVLEVAVAGSPYAFAGKSSHGTSGISWTCLFPEKGMEDISPKDAANRICGALDEMDPDVVFAGAIAYPSGAAAVRWARNRLRPVVIMDSARMEDVPRSPWVNWVKKRIFANVNAVLIPAPSHAPGYKLWGIPERRMCFGLNVVDNAFFAERAAQARQAPEKTKMEFQLPEHFFLGVGRQIEKKNWGALIQAFGAASKKFGEEWGLVLVGDGPEATKLRRMASTFGNKIVFLPFQDQETLCRLYGVADCLVLPSSYGETWGLVVNEAMASNLPVIVSKESGCAKTLVRDGFNGWRFDPTKNIGQLQSRISRFMKMPEEDRNLMGQNSLNIISNWGMARFCQGVWRAIKICHRAPVWGYEWPIIDKGILRLWKGRYRPV